MIKYKKKTTVQRETFERVRVLRRGVNSRQFCAQCVADADFLTLDQAVSLTKIGMREMLQRIETQELHALETMSGHLLVCQNSLHAA